MTNEIEEDEKEQVSVVPAEAQINFLQRNPLTKTLKRIDRSTESAIAYLESVVKNEEASSKERISAAQYLIDKKIAISDLVTRDALSRSIAQARQQMAIQATQQKCIKNVTEEGDEEDMQPKYLPTVILDHSNLKEM